MNPIALIRGITYAALPLALGLAARQRRLDRTAGDAEEAENENPVATPRRLSRLERNELRGYLEGGGAPSRVDLTYGAFDRIRLPGRDLEDVDMSHASLRGAELRAASLAGSKLDFADLSKADLKDANLARSSLVEANLWHSDLCGTQLAECPTLAVANVRGAKYDRFTRWPRGFDPDRAGAVRARFDF